MRTRSNPFFNRMSLIALAVAAAQSGSVLAQGLEEVVVTARKMAEDLQRTPVSVVAVSGDDLRDIGITNLETLGSFVPNLTIGQSMGYGGASFTIRGIGGGQGAISQDGSVGIYIDDVYYPRAQGALLELLDVEQIEILRGPQGTLFGRNTSGGAVRYVSTKPSPEFEGRIKGTVGNLGTHRIEAVANIPLSDTVSTRFGYGATSRDGVMRRLNDGDKMGAEDVDFVRGQIRWQPSERLDINVAVDSIATEDNGFARDIVLIDPTDMLPTRLGDPGYNESLVTPDKWSVVGGDPDYGLFESEGVTMNIAYDINDRLQLLSITGYRDNLMERKQDFDHTSYDIYQVDIEHDFSNISQEFQLSGTTADERLNWVTGVYYMYEKAREKGIRNNPADGVNFPLDMKLKTKSYAVFGQATYNLTDALSTTLGLRWSMDEKDGFMSRGRNSAENSDSWKSVTPRLGLEYQINDDIMVYTSAAKGYKSGGFNDTPRPGAADDGAVPYDPEELWTYEVGFRSEFANSRIRLNATYFYTDFDDIQVPATFTDPNLQTRIQVWQNVATATIEGIEIEATAMITDRWLIQASGGWTDASYDEIGSAQGLTTRTPFQRTPEFSYTFATSYTLPLAAGSEVQMNLNYGWKDDQTNNNTDTNNVWLPSYGLLNGRVTYFAGDGRWSIAAYGKNLLDEDYLVSAFDPSSRGNFMGFIQHDRGRPREYGVELTVNF